MHPDDLNFDVEGFTNLSPLQFSYSKWLCNPIIQVWFDGGEYLRLNVKAFFFRAAPRRVPGA
jgi:hypothetical protein